MSETRFAFGKNWSMFLACLDETRIGNAERSLANMLGRQDLTGLSFLDVGCGSGLFSLAARRLGAKVISFDYDPLSVACAEELKRRFFPGDSDWIIQQGSALDPIYINSLGKHDVVYSWGVLHHTGEMWKALELVKLLVKKDGQLFIALYNDQGAMSRVWLWIKRRYVNSGKFVRFLLVAGVGLLGELAVFMMRFLSGQNPFPFQKWRELKKNRGMSPWYDLVDWVGGYPFEVAKPEDVFDFYRQSGYQLERLTTRGGRHGCNEFVFRRVR